MDVKKIEIEINGQNEKVIAQKIKGVLWVHWRGRTFSVLESSGRKSKKSGSGASQPGVIKAPMPGKITKILVNISDGVELGQSLVVMEAMKMEYTLKADMVGAICDLNCLVGDQVRLGQPLIVIK